MIHINNINSTLLDKSVIKEVRYYSRKWLRKSFNVTQSSTLEHIDIKYALLVFDELTAIREEIKLMNKPERLGNINVNVPTCSINH